MPKTLEEHLIFLFLSLPWISSVPPFALFVFILFPQDLRDFNFKLSALHHMWYLFIYITLSCLLKNTHFLTEKHVSELLRLVASLRIHINISLHYSTNKDFNLSWLFYLLLYLTPWQTWSLICFTANNSFAFPVYFHTFMQYVLFIYKDISKYYRCL